MVGRIILPAAMLLLAAGCTQKRQTVLSGDTAYEMQSSIVMLSHDLPPARKDEFDQAVATIIFSATDRRFSANGDRLSPQSIKLLRGRSVHEVIEDAKLLRTVARY